MLTLAKIAAETGLCKATVSFVLNGKAKEKHISQKTVNKIQDFCRKNNYQPNIHAIRISRKIVGNIMLLIHMNDDIDGQSSFSEYNASRIADGVIREAEKSGFSVLTRMYGKNYHTEQMFNSFRNREIDGMIYYGFHLPQEWLKVFREEKRHIVGIGIEPVEGIASVNIDNFAISEALTEKLISGGKREFIYMQGILDSYPAKERFAGFMSALQKHHLKFWKRCSLHGEFQEKIAHREIQKYFEQYKMLPDAVVCANDSMAIGVIRYLQRKGILIPEQIAVAGGDNTLVSAYITPALTTFDNRAADLGKAAFQNLYNKIHGRKTVNDTVIQSGLCCRDSA